MKRFLLLGAATVVACGMPSEVTTPTSAAVSGTSYSVADSGSSSCPSPSPLPYANFGHPRATGCTSGPSQITPFFKATPTHGFAPLTVNFGMCGSTDSDPSITLHYHVDFGDGGSTGGHACSFSHQYTTPGTYTATECVWDEIPADAPGSCQSFGIQVDAACSVTYLFTQYTCGNFVDAIVQTQGDSPTCGDPLVVGAYQNGSLVGSSKTHCPPGAKPAGDPATGGFLILPFTLLFPTQCAVTFTVPQFQPVTLSGLNAVGSTVVNPPGC